MIFRRNRDRGEQPDAPLDDPVEPAESTGADTTAATPAGPYDAADVDLDRAESARLDLGGLLVAARPHTEVRLQVDEGSGTVLAVLVVTEKSALELRAFAAPRSEGIWADVRREIAAEATRQGGTASESAGPFGAELKLVMPARATDGVPAMQVSRVVGVDGPRWLLRGTFMGGAVERAGAADLEDVFRDVVVVRGSTPMAPREPLPLALPADGQLPGDPQAT